MLTPVGLLNGLTTAYQVRVLCKCKQRGVLSKRNADKRERTWEWNPTGKRTKTFIIFFLLFYYQNPFVNATARGTGIVELLPWSCRLRRRTPLAWTWFSSVDTGKGTEMTTWKHRRPETDQTTVRWETPKTIVEQLFTTLVGNVNYNSLKNE